jgi:hypothetical protein
MRKTFKRPPVIKKASLSVKLSLHFDQTDPGLLENLSCRVKSFVQL